MNPKKLGLTEENLLVLGVFCKNARACRFDRLDSG
jgi:hypothetical protein